MQSDILKKLQAQLSKLIEAECQVVYVLVEIRKLFEHIGKDDCAKNYPSLMLHCDWAVHSRLGGRLAMELIAKLNDLWQEPESFSLTDEEFKELSGILAFDNFRRELRQFLQAQPLPTGFCDSDDEWRRFIHLYSSVVQDSPLKFTSPPISVQPFDEMIISKKEDEGFLWDLYYQGKKKWCLELTEDCKLLGSRLSTP